MTTRKDELRNILHGTIRKVPTKVVERALTDLDRGEYGVCITCDAPIPIARLRALPFAQCCRECQEQQEEIEQRQERAAQKARANRLGQCSLPMQT